MSLITIWDLEREGKWVAQRRKGRYCKAGEVMCSRHGPLISRKILFGVHITETHMILTLLTLPSVGVLDTIGPGFSSCFFRHSISVCFAGLPCSTDSFYAGLLLIVMLQVSFLPTCIPGSFMHLQDFNYSLYADDIQISFWKLNFSLGLHTTYITVKISTVHQLPCEELWAPPFILSLFLSFYIQIITMSFRVHLLNLSQIC